ncbi:MAG: NigD-like C-terminal domain-containing protein [Bacteroidales bacterium]|nr:NigD-like C-terminal domain-containing protein [Bacteroidales bacterium]
MKQKLSYILIGVMALATLTSCINNDHTPSSINLSFAIGELRANSLGDGYLMMDDSTTMGISPSIQISDSIANHRYYIEGYLCDDNHSFPGYDLTMDATVLLPVAIDTILEVNTNEQQTNVGIDKYNINTNGIFITGRYINVFMYVPASGNVKHRISLIHNTLSPIINDKNDTIYLELCHNANNDMAQQDYRSILSFDIQNYINQHPDHLVFGIWHYSNSVDAPKELKYYNVYNN